MGAIRQPGCLRDQEQLPKGACRSSSEVATAGNGASDADVKAYAVAKERFSCFRRSRDDRVMSNDILILAHPDGQGPVQCTTIASWLHCKYSGKFSPGQRWTTDLLITMCAFVTKPDHFAMVEGADTTSNGGHALYGIANQCGF